MMFISENSLLLIWVPWRNRLSQKHWYY